MRSATSFHSIQSSFFGFFCSSACFLLSWKLEAAEKLSLWRWSAAENCSCWCLADALVRRRQQCVLTTLSGQKWHKSALRPSFLDVGGLSHCLRPKMFSFESLSLGASVAGLEFFHTNHFWHHKQSGWPWRRTLRRSSWSELYWHDFMVQH